MGREGERAGSGPTEKKFGQLNFRKMHQKKGEFNLGVELKDACRERQHIRRRKKEEIKTEGCEGRGGGGINPRPTAVM